MTKKATGMGGGDHTKGGSNPSRCDRTGVAMVQDPRSLIQQGNAMIHQPLGQQTILALNRIGHTGESINIRGV